MVSVNYYRSIYNIQMLDRQIDCMFNLGKVIFRATAPHTAPHRRQSRLRSRFAVRCSTCAVSSVYYTSMALPWQVLTSDLMHVNCAATADSNFRFGARGLRCLEGFQLLVSCTWIALPSKGSNFRFDARGLRCLRRVPKTFWFSCGVDCAMPAKGSNLLSIGARGLRYLVRSPTSGLVPSGLRCLG